MAAPTGRPARARAALTVAAIVVAAVCAAAVTFGSRPYIDNPTAELKTPHELMPGAGPAGPSAEAEGGHAALARESQLQPVLNAFPHREARAPRKPRPARLQSQDRSLQDPPAPDRQGQAAKQRALTPSPAGPSAAAEVPSALLSPQETVVPHESFGSRNTPPAAGAAEAPPPVNAAPPPPAAAAPPRAPVLTPPVPVDLSPPPHPLPYRMVIEPPGLAAVARLEAVEARARIRLVIHADGMVGRVEIASTSGRSELDAAALDAARRWRFLPARSDGQAIESVALIWVAFIVTP